jgi:4-hydroxybenzoate polyprenyltransferase
MIGIDEDDRSFPRLDRLLVACGRLVRIPNLFTSPPDVILGMAIAAGLGYTVSIESAIGLTVASVLLYAAGTTLNDYCDTAADARERPERPIPAGDVSRTGALVFGVVLLGSGVVVALMAGGAITGAVAVLLALLVVLYDGVFKGSPIGFLLMGGTRGTNVILGLSAATIPTALPIWSLSIPVVITLYIASVTYMAESETEESDPLAVSVAVGGVAVATVGTAGVIVARSPSAIDTAVAVTFLIGFVVWTGRTLWPAYTAPSPATIRPAVGTCVLGIIILDAAFAATTGFVWSFVIVACIVPAMGLARVFDMS